MKPDFEIFNGKKYPIIWRKDGELITDECPFCSQLHSHALSEGHRRAACIDKYRMEEENQWVMLSDGTVAFQEDGYVLKNY